MHFADRRVWTGHEARPWRVLARTLTFGEETREQWCASLWWRPVSWRAWIAVFIEPVDLARPGGAERPGDQVGLPADLPTFHLVLALHEQMAAGL